MDFGRYSQVASEQDNKSMLLNDYANPFTEFSFESYTHQPFSNNRELSRQILEQGFIDFTDCSVQFASSTEQSVKSIATASPKSGAGALDLTNSYQKLLGQIERTELANYCKGFAFDHQKIENVRNEIAEASTADIQSTICKQIDNSDVVIFGETHVDKPNFLRLLGTELMPKLKQAGATHFAIELDTNRQFQIQQFMATGELPKDLEERWSDSYKRLVQAARQNGLIIRAIDNHDVTFLAGENRDQKMAENVEKIFSEQPKSKVVIWVGAYHASHENLGSAAYRSVASHLDDSRKVVSIYAQLNGDEFPNLITPDMKKPVMLSTTATPRLSDSKLSNETLPQRVGGYNFLILVPRNQRL
jgi:hypothetical protein